jgi:AraC family transcriptional regulator, transcriptional activator of pobA
LLLVSLFRIDAKHQGTGVKEDQRMLQYYQSFYQNIRKSIHATKSIVEYAAELNITTVHLNRICKKLVKKSALDVVNEHLIMECKKYLLNTNYTISQISYLFNFDDPAYFTKVFKRMTGVTPKEFRK